uniref:PH_RBD domain-containing protein n=1 Tax=Heterorhabditis bacteriophora TaxID=37862 RepID=A0A1I7XS16_HETBA
MVEYLVVLTVGPCAASFKRMSEGREPSAEELVWRDSIMPVSPNPARPPLSMMRQGSCMVSAERASISRDYVYSLHHNFKSSLLYGKNNVCVANSDQSPVKGYLSLHKSYEGNLTLKWTPNQLMHASSQPSSANSKDPEQQWLWRQAINIEIDDIIYIHLHQRDEFSPSSLTLVNCEGVQCPPLQLPVGQHSLRKYCPVFGRGHQQLEPDQCWTMYFELSESEEMIPFRLGLNISRIRLCVLPNSENICCIWLIQGRCVKQIVELMKYFGRSADKRERYIMCSFSSYILELYYCFVESFF